MLPTLAFVILLNLIAIVDANRPIKLPITNYSLAINIERQLKSSTGIPVAKKSVIKPGNYTLLEDLVDSYTRSYNRIFPAITQNLKKLSTLRTKFSHKKKKGVIRPNTNWEIAQSSPGNKLTCSVQLGVPDSTVLARVVNRDSPKMALNSPYTCIQVLNTLRRTNPNGIEMIYYKSNLPFEHLLSMASIPTLLVGVLIDYPLLIKLFSYVTFGYIMYSVKDFLWYLTIKILNSRLFWHPTVYNIWCNIYYKTSGPAKLFTIKQILDNLSYLCGKMYNVLLNATIRLEGVMLEDDLRKHLLAKANKEQVLTLDLDKNRLNTFYFFQVRGISLIATLIAFNVETTSIALLVKNSTNLENKLVKLI